MPGLRLMCPICTEEFEENEEIYSTSCGHIYHFSCMSSWRSRSTSCPQCRTHEPATHKLYLIISDGAEDAPSAPNAEEVDDLKIKLDSSIDKVNELRAQLQEGELNLLHMQEQYTIEQRLKKQLEQRIAQVNENDNNFLQLHAQYSECEEQIKILREENERLSLENDYKSQEMSLRQSEISTLKESMNVMTEEDLLDERVKLLKLENERLKKENDYKSKEIAVKTKDILKLRETKNANNTETSDLVLNTKIDILEQRLRHITGVLEQEISNSTQLAIDKIKLQSHIQRLELPGNGQNVINLSEQNKMANAMPQNRQSVPVELPSTSSQQMTQVANRKPAGKNRQPVSMELPSTSSQQMTQVANRKPAGNNSVQNNQNTNKLVPLVRSASTLVRSASASSQQSVSDIEQDHCIIFSKFPKNEIRFPLSTFIISLSKKMELDIKEDDIIKSSLIGGGVHTMRKEVSIIVQLRTSDLKSAFLSKRNVLKNDPAFKYVLTKEYVDPRIHAIYVYASKKLRGVVYDYIAVKNDTILAKKTNRDRETLVIYSTQQVDEILQKAQESQTVPRRSLVVGADEIDECFYKI